jgi:hypothetical protein
MTILVAIAFGFLVGILVSDRVNRAVEEWIRRSVFEKK